jgi:fibronectin-binding autotransporter adhesin
VSSGTLGMDANSDTVSAFTLSGGTLGGSGTLTATTYTLSGGTLTANLGGGTATASTGTTALNGTLGANLTVNGGTVNLGSANRISDSATVALSSGTLGMGANNDTVSAFTLSGGTLGGSGTLTASTYTLSGGTLTANLGGGTATASTGTTSLNGTSGANLTVNGGTLNLGSDDRIGDSSTVAISSGTLGISTFSDTVSTFTISSTGTLDGSTGVLTAGSYALEGGTINAGLGTGAITVTTATTTLGSANRLNSASTLTINSGQLSLGGAETVASLAGSGGTLALDGNTISVGGGDTSTSFAGAITGTGGGLTKTGTGTLTLSGNSSYTGATTLSGGGLVINGTNTSTAVTVGNDTILGGSGSLGAVTIQAGGRIAPGNSPGTLSVSSLTLEAGSGYNWELDNVTGTAGTNWDLISVGGGTGTVTINATSGSPHTIYISGAATGFTNTGSYSWTIIDAGTLSGFDANDFGVNFTTLNGQTPTGTFSFSNVSGDLILAYAAAASVYDVTVAADTAANQGSAQATNSVAQFTGASALNKLGAGTLIMTNSANDYTGVTTIKEGTLQINVAAPNASAGALGNASSAVVVGDAAAAAAAGFNFGEAVTNARGLSIVAGTGAADRIISTTFGSGTAAQSGTVVMNTNTTFSIASGGTLNVSGVVSGAGTLTKVGAGTLTLSANNTYTGNTVVGVGTLALGAANRIADSSNLTVSNSATFALNNFAESLGSISGGGTISLGSATLTSTTTANTTFSGDITGTGGLVKAGSGTLTLSGSNSYSGTTAVNAGGVVVGDNNAFGSGIVSLADGTTLSSDASARTLSNNMNIRRIAFEGTGALTLNGNLTNNRGAAITVTNSVAGGLTMSNLALSHTTTGRDVTLAGSGNTTINGVISDGGAGATSEFLIENTGTTTLNGANTFSGGFTLSAGTLVIGNNAALGSGSVTFDDGVTVNSDATARNVANDIDFRNLQIGGTGALTLSGTLTHTRAGGSTLTNNNAAGLTLGNINLASSSVNREVTFAGTGDTAVTGVIANGGTATASSIVLNATGTTLTLSGANTYGGATTITAGTLLAANDTALGADTTGTTVADGATLAFSNNVNSSEAITISGNGVLSGGALRNVSGNNTNTGNVVLGATSRIQIDSGSSLTLSNIDTTFGTRNLVVSANGTLTVLGAISNSTVITNVLQKDGLGNMIVSNNGTTGGIQLQVGAGAFTLASGSFSTNTSTTGSAASPRAIDLGISASGDSTNDVAFYANGGVTVSNSIYVAPSGSGSSATRTLGTESTSGTATFDNEIYLGGNLNVSAASGGTALFSGNIVNNGNLTKTNTGTVVLAGANTFGGAVAVDEGTLVVSNSAAINDTNAVTIASSATLSLGSSETVGSITGGGNITLLGNQLIAGGNGSSTEFSGVMSSSSDAASFVKTGAGTLTLSGANTMNGQLYLVNGTTLFTANQGSGFTNTINIGETNGAAAATLAFGGSGLSVTNPINVRSGNDGLMTIEAQNSTGTLALEGNLTLSKNATLKATNGGEVLLSGAVDIGASQLFTENTSGSDITISGNISADAARTGELLLDDTGTVFLTGNNSANMKVTLSQGTLVVGNITNLGDPSGTFFGSKLNLNGGTLSATNDVTAGANFGVTVSANGGNLLASSGKTLKFVDFINDTGAGTAAYTLGIGGGGTVIFEKASGNNQFNSNMTFSVTNGSTLSTPNLLALGNSSTNIISLNNGTFAYTGNTGTASQRFTIGASGGTINVSSNGQTLTLTNAATLTGALTKSGNGILDINRANTGTGGADVTGGILRIGNASALGTGGTVAVSSGATLQLSNGISFARNMTLSGNGTVSGALLSVNGANTNSGGITLGADSVIGVSDGSLLVSGNITNGGNRLTLDTYGVAGTPLTVGGIISGNGGLTKIGGGTAVLTGANSYTNTTLIGVGTLQVGSGGTSGQLGTGAVTISNGATLSFNRSDAITANNNIDGAGTLIKSGASTLTLGGANTYSGGTLISAGTLAGTTGGIQGNITNSGALIFDQSTTGTYGGIISGTGTLAKTNSGTVSLTGANTFSGGVTVNAGTLALNRSGGPALGGTNAIIINTNGTLRTDAAGQIVGAPLVTVNAGGTYNLNGFNQTNALTGGGSVTLGAGTLSISNTGSDTFSGVASGEGGLTKVGAGAQTLSGSNTYTGATTITEGELAIGADDVIGDSSAVTVNGGTFTLGARAETVASLTMSSGTVARGGGILTLNGASALTGGTVSYTAAGASLIFGSTLDLGGVAFSYGSASTPSGSQDTVRLGGNVGYASSATGQALFTNTSTGVGAFDLGDTQRTFNLTNSGTLGAGTPEMAVYWEVRDGGITKDGTGALLLGRANTHTNTTLTAGDLLVGDNAAVGAGTVNLNGGTFASADATARTITNDLSIGGEITLGQVSGGTGVLTFSNADLGSGTRSITAVTNVNFVGAVTNGSLTKAGNATLALSNTGTSLANLNITAGTVAVQTNASVGGLAGSGAGALSLAGGTLTVNASTNSSFAQAITGSGALTKSGAGTLTLTASNNFSGATTISGGALVVNGTNTGSAVSVGSTGTLGGAGSVGATTVQNGGFISPGNSIGTLSVDTLTLEGGGGYVWEVADVTGSAGTDYDLISVGGGAGSATVTATTGSPFTIYLTSYTGFTNWDSSGTFSWNIIDWGAVTGFDASAFTVNTNDFSGTISGAFTFANTNGYLVMSYEAGIPTYDTNSGTWSGGFVPALANGNSILFDGPGGNATNDISSATVANIGNLTFSNTAGSYTLSADSGSAGFDSASALVVNGNIVNNSSNAQTINLALGFDAERTIDAAAGDMTFSGAISNGTGLIFTGASNNTVSGVVSAAGTVAKTGSGTLFLDGANTYTGATTISNGVVQLGNAAGLGATNGGTTVVSGATLDLNGQTVGNEALSLAGTGVGGNGALINSSASAASLSGAITLTGNTVIGTTSGMTLTGVMGGGFSLTKTGAATLTLDAVNTYSGGTVVNAGVVFADNDSGFGSGSITVNGGGIGSTGSRTIANNIVAGGDFFMGGSSTVYNGTFDLGGATRTITFSNKATLNGIISNGGLTISAGGIATDIVMDGVNTYTGPTTINGGELILTNDGSLSASTAVDLTGSAGTAALDIEFISGESTTIGSLAASNNASTTTVTLGTKTLVAGGNNDNTIFNGSMEGTGGFTKAGTGTMTVGAANSYTGATTISNGEIALSGSGRLADTTAVNLAGATARYDISAKDATTETNGSLAGVAGSIVNLGGKTLNVGGNDASTTFAGVISNTGSLIKSGTGTMTLSGANTFSGGSTLSAGVLRVDNTSGLGTGTLVQSDGTSTLQINAGGTIANNMSVYNVEFVNGGNTLSGTITNNNTVYDVASGTTNTVSGFVTGSGGVELIGGGQLNLTGTTNNYTGNTVISNGTLQISTLANSNTVSSIGVSNNITLAGADATNAVLDYTGGNVTTDRTFVLNDGGGTINLATATTTNTLTGSASGTGTLIVGEGTLVLSNGSTSNSFAPGAIQVDSGATLELAANNQIGDSTGLILNGGTFRVGTATTGFSDTLGTLTLSASSTIDLGAWTTGVRQLTFANSSAITWTGTLTITNWQGVANTSSDVAEILFGTGGLSSGQLAQVYWGNQDLTGGTLIGGNGELVPVPEPRVYAAAVALLAVVGWRERKRLLGLIQRTKKS